MGGQAISRGNDRSVRGANLFIVGAPRAGTTSLANWLAQHPEIFLGKRKEPGYYVVDLPMRNRISDAADYAARFADGDDRRYRLDATPWYLHAEEALPAIAADVPDAQLIVNLRSPAEFLPSLHNHHVFKGLETQTDLAAALFTKRTAGTEDFRESLDYLSVGRLGAQVQRVLEHFPRNRVHFIRFRHLTEIPRITHTRLLGELGLEEIPLSAYERYNAGQQQRSALVGAAAGRIAGPDAPRWRHRIAGRINRLNSRPRSGDAAIATKRRIIEELQDDIALLAELTGFDLSEWMDVDR